MLESIILRNIPLGIMYFQSMSSSWSERVFPVCPVMSSVTLWNILSFNVFSHKIRADRSYMEACSLSICGGLVCKCLLGPEGITDRVTLMLYVKQGEAVLLVFLLYLTQVWWILVTHRLTDSLHLHGSALHQIETLARHCDRPAPTVATRNAHTHRESNPKPWQKNVKCTLICK